MPIPIKLFVVWVLLSFATLIGTMVVNSVGDYPTGHWSFVWNGYALASLGCAFCVAILAVGFSIIFA